MDEGTDAENNTTERREKWKKKKTRKGELTCGEDPVALGGVNLLFLGGGVVPDPGALRL